MVKEADIPRNNKTAYFPMYDAAGCFPLPKQNADILKTGDPKELGELIAYKSSGLGSNPSGPDIDLCRQLEGRDYPKPELPEMGSPITDVAVHRAPVTFSPSIYYSFKPHVDKQLREPDDSQVSLLRWYRNEKDCLEVPFAFGAVVAPPKYRIYEAWYCVECPVPGIEFDLVESYSGDVIAAGIDGGVEGSAPFDIDLAASPWAYSHDKIRVLDLCITAMPEINEDDCKTGPSALDGFKIGLTMLMCRYCTGNA